MVRTKADGITRNDFVESKFSAKDLAPLPHHFHPNEIDIPFFDVDLAKIFYKRSTLRIERIFETLSHHNYEISEKDISCLKKEIIENMLFPSLKDEIERYGKKSKNRYDYKEDIEHAQEGNNESFFRLIEWDKGWLFIDWVENRILQAQEKGDSQFIKALGEAVGAVPRIQRPLGAVRGIKGQIAAKDREKRKLMIRTMEATIPYYLSKSRPASRQKTFNRVTRVFFDAFFNYGLPKTEPWYWQEEGFGTNLGSFRQYIKRHLTINLD